MLLSLSARTVSVVQSGHPWFKSGWGYLFIVFVDFMLFLFYYYYFFFFHLLFDSIFIRSCNFVTKIAKHSSQKFDIDTRNIRKAIFSCGLWWFVGVCNIAVEAYWLATGRVWCVFSLSSFCLLVSDEFGQKYDIFSLLCSGQNLLGAWGRCKSPWGGHFFFIALKHGADTFFLQSQAMGRTLFSTTLKPMRRYLKKKMQLQLYFSLKWHISVEMQLHL